MEKISALILMCSFCALVNGDILSSMDQLLTDGIAKSVYPGVTAIVGTLDGRFQYSKTFGNFNYSTESPAISLDTHFDIASLSKVVSTTSAVALLYQMGYIHLSDPISKFLGESFNSNGKENITVLNCLLHNSGFPPDPNPWYWGSSFGCPNTTPDVTVTPAEDFSCLKTIFTSLLTKQTLQSVTGEVFTYSDLSFITLHLVAGATVYKNKLVAPSDLRSECSSIPDLYESDSEGILYTCYFEAFVKKNVFSFDSMMPSTGYVLKTAEERANSAPTENDNVYIHSRIQGYVSDGDCYAMGGICGHAGIFSTGRDLSVFLPRLLRAAVEVEPSSTSKVSPFMLNHTTMVKFTTIHNVSQSSRALGWTTNTPLAKDYGYDNSCGAMSTLTFMHTGYTGGCICVDPVNAVWSAVLTNRVYNCDGQSCPTGSSDSLKAIYKQFNTLVASAVQPSSTL